MSLIQTEIIIYISNEMFLASTTHIFWVRLYTKYIYSANPQGFSALFQARSRFPPLATPKRPRRGPSTRNPFDRRREQFFFLLLHAFPRPLRACARCSARARAESQLPSSGIRKVTDLYRSDAIHNISNDIDNAIVRDDTAAILRGPTVIVHCVFHWKLFDVFETGAYTRIFFKRGALISLYNITFEGVGVIYILSI